MSDVQILITGRYFAGSGYRSFEPVLEELLVSAKREVHIVSYVLTQSALPFLHRVEEALYRGVQVCMVCDEASFTDEEVSTRLFDIEQRYSAFMKLVRFHDPEGSRLHAKVVVVDRQKAVVGSANLSWGGLAANHEIGLLVEGNIAWSLADLIDALVSTIAGL